MTKPELHTSDADLIRAAVDDPDAFHLLYVRYAEPLHRFFMRRTGSAEAGFELTAETFAQAWISRGRFRDMAGGSAGPWLFAIARRVLMSSVTRRRIETKMLKRLEVILPRWDGEEMIPDARWLDDLDADVEEALATLPGDQLRAIELRVLDELSYAGIARRLRCSPTAARIRVSRGLATLRARLEGYKG